ncbi:hypothetical protein BU15DRAFT_80127 [Melanogaster broomeanus]|nr:hypothetical protein BU15DRAFT_80127 [Melanogaster broomeanus]
MPSNCHLRPVSPEGVFLDWYPSWAEDFPSSSFPTPRPSPSTPQIIVHMTVPIPVYRQNPDNSDWEVASLYGSDGCESLGRSVYDDSVYSGSLDDPALELPPEPPPSAQTPQEWDARFVPGKPGGFFIQPPAVPPPGTVRPSPDRVFSSREIYMPSGTDRMAPESDVMLFDAPPLPMPRASPQPPPPLRPPSSPMPRPAPALVIPQALSSQSHSRTGSKHASPIMPPSYHELTMVPHATEVGYQKQMATPVSPSRRSAHDAGSSYSIPSQPHRGQAIEDLAPDMRHSQMRAPSGQYSFPTYPSHPSGERVDRSQAQVEYDRGGGAGGMRMARSQTRQRRPSVWQRFVRKFSPSRGSVGQSQS